MSECFPGNADPALYQRDIPLHPEEQELLAAMYAQRCEDLRGSVQAIFEKLQGQEPKPEGYSWAKFKLAQIAAEGDLPRRHNDREILIALDYRQSQHDPMVRIITNERFAAENGRVQRLTRDFSLNHEDDARYFVDSSQELHGSIYTIDSPTFSVQGDALFTYRLNWQTPIRGVTEFVQPDPAQGPRFATAFPLGTPNNLLDRFDAVASADEILGEIAPAKPTAWQTMQPTA
jgi:hypothetical protein